jgi:hypothetical protein
MSAYAEAFADIIEEIITEEIVDETDRFEDNQSKRKAKRMTTKAIMEGCASPSAFHALALTTHDLFSADAFQDCRAPSAQCLECDRNGSLDAADAFARHVSRACGRAKCAVRRTELRRDGERRRTACERALPDAVACSSWCNAQRNALNETWARC